MRIARFNEASPSTADARRQTCHVGPGTLRRRTQRLVPGGTSAARHRADDEERLSPRRDGGGKQRIGELVGQIVLASEETHVRTTSLRCGIANSPLQDRKTSFERVDHRPLGGRTDYVEFDFAADVGERSQMFRQDEPDHANVWTSTESTDGRSRTIGFQLSPALFDT